MLNLSIALQLLQFHFYWFALLIAFNSRKVFPPPGFEAWVGPMKKLPRECSLTLFSEVSLYS